MAVPFARGLRYMYDAQQRFWRVGLPVYLRVKNFVDQGQMYTELGYQIVPADPNTAGTQDLLIDPPPIVKEVALNEIALLNDTGKRLMFGARHFYVSHTWVLARMLDQNYTDGYEVFRADTVMGLFYNSRLFTIESITHNEAGGETITWHLVANSAEELSTA